MAIRILLADEHQMIRQGLRNLLDKEPDFQVVAEADTGEAAVRLAQETMPDVVILDLTMVGLKGVAPVQQLVGAVSSAKVIGVSIYSDRRFVVEVLKAGAFGYLLKDYAFEELVPAIRAVQAHKTYISQGLSDLVIQDYIELLRDSETRFRTIFEGSSIGIALVDQEGRIVESNPALQELVGYNQDEIRNKQFSELAPPEEADRWWDHYRDLMAGSLKSCQAEKQYRRKDGGLAWGRLSAAPLRGAGSEDQFAIGMLEDISDQKQAEAEIRNYQEKLRSVALELSLTEERERRRLATDLHDHVGQILALAQIKLGALRESASSNLIAPMDEIRHLLEQTIRYTRSLTFELSPPILYDLGFEAAVEWLAELIQEQSGIRLQVEADWSPKPLDDERRVLLFQLVRELLLNVVKRSRAENVSVVIRRNGLNMQVRIENDGDNLELEGSSGATSDRLGLFGIRERLEYLGGRLVVESIPERGTRVSLEVPLKY